MRSDGIITTKVGTATHSPCCRGPGHFNFNASQSTRPSTFTYSFATRIEMPGLSFLVEALHALVHLAFSIFLVGFLLYLSKFNTAVFRFALAAIALSLVAYAGLTVLPIIQPSSPYSTPFSKIITVAYAGVLILYSPDSVFQTLPRIHETVSKNWANRGWQRR